MMERLTSPDYQAVIDILASLQVSRNREDLARFIIPRLAKLLASDITSYHEVNPVAGTVTGFIEPDEFKIASLGKTLAQFMHEHPVIMHNQNNRNSSALRISGFISHRELHDSGLYHELYRPMGVKYQICVPLPTRKPLIAALVFNRKVSDFSQRARTMLNILQPHLIGAFKHAKATDRLQKSLERHHGALENLPDGVVVLNGSSRADLWTEKARLWIGKYFPGPARASSALPEEISAWLRRQLSSTNGHAAAGSALTKVKGTDQLALRLICLPGKGRMLVLSETRLVDSARPLEALGLSPRQAETLLHLSQGNTNEQIARKLNISARTVQKHLETIFRVLKVSSRTAAARMAFDRFRTLIVTFLVLAIGAMDAVSLLC